MPHNILFWQKVLIIAFSLLHSLGTQRTREREREPMELLDFLILLSFLFIFINGLSRIWIRQSNPRKLPPGPVGFPIIGSLLQVGDRPHESLAALAKSYGPLMCLRLGFTTTVVASSPEMAQEILQKNDLAFSGRFIPDAVTAEPHYDLSMAWQPVGPCWRSYRKICNAQIFTTQRLDALQNLRDQKMGEMLAVVREFATTGEAVNIGRLAFATTINLVSNSIFSVDVVEPGAAGAEEFKEVVWRVMEYAAKPNLSDYFPFLKQFDVQGIRRRMTPAYLRLHGMVDEMIDERLKSRDCGSSRRDDFLDLLLDNIQEKGADLDRRHVKLLITDLFIAGGDTSATTIEWTMAELLRNQDILSKVQKEVMEIVGPGRAVHESHIPRLPYLQAVVKEAMRLHPTVPLLLPHTSEMDVQVCGYFIPKHTQVFVNVWAIARDGSSWEDPNRFMPDRFLGSDHSDPRGRDWRLLPFGAGRRICPGLPLAMRMVHLVVASLLHSFEWKLPQGTTPENMNMSDKFGVTLQMAVPLLAIPSKRML